MYRIKLFHFSSIHVFSLFRQADDMISRLKRENEAAKVATSNTLKQENRELRTKINKMKEFLTDDQIKMLREGRIPQWPNGSIIKVFKFRFALSVHGYKFLRSTGYPPPPYSTLMRRIQDFQLNLGISSDVLELLRRKS